MAEDDAADPVLDGAGLTCSIPANGANAPLALAVDGDLPVVLREEIRDRGEFEAFGCEVPKRNDAETPDEMIPDARFRREVHSEGFVEMPDGERIHTWGFEDPDRRNGEPRRPFPSPLMRVREGQIAHTWLKSSKNTHTIHHHGIEPTPHNDGVGHTSFEVGNTYTYQWRPTESGSYFYHCHKNTVLHWEMGMYGPLIVDPAEGPGFVRRRSETIRYDHEAIWIPDDIDPLWHDPDTDHDAGMDCEGDFDDSEHLLRFEPKYWVLSGVPHPFSRDDPSVAVTCRVGETVLIRLLNAAYGPIRVRLPFQAECIGRDGHTLGGGRVERYSRPYIFAADETIEASSAQRFDLLVVPDRAGTFTVPIDFAHWVTDASYGRVETTITVT